MRLIIETSSFYSSVALFDSSGYITSIESDQQNSHAETLHILIKQVLENEKIMVSDIDGLIMGGGPGSNTGLRIGLATLKGLSMFSLCDGLPYL